MPCEHSAEDSCRVCYDDLVAKYNSLKAQHAQLMADYKTAVTKRDELQAAIVSMNRVTVEQGVAVMDKVAELAAGELKGFYEWAARLEQLVHAWQTSDSAATRARGYDLEELMKMRRIIPSTQDGDE